MRYRVRLKEIAEFVTEGNNEEEIMDFLRSHTIEEVKQNNPDVQMFYEEEIVEKTVFPTEVDVEKVEEIYEEK